ncbi:cell envelope integrity EipB family protein [Rhodomicrobium vannielii ATCC 17100]|uniref:cell envelope integrity EipB family protein n=1 Tax=Rhodomicrobium vannielii TaxID=1069 RepID=UPI001918D365|nr:cell envelope integrity EipB family protein [Rhodomicrobium vannielii]MBJ7536032.1 cell envelope integrity EipB family protein [Rhodomicrobium vannielii ATCC 17100]
MTFFTMPAVAAVSGWLGLSACVALSCAPASAQEKPAEAIELAPHRAVYELVLDRTGAGSNISDIRGQLTYDFTGSACQGYTLNTRLVTEIYDREGKQSTTDTRSESVEDGEGRRFRFNTSQYMNKSPKPADATSGLAVRAPKGGRETVTVTLYKPKKGSFTLPGNIYFPTQHSIAILKAAKAGDTRLQADFFDGSDKGTKIYETTTVIGAPLQLAANAQLPTIKNAEILDSIQSWPVVVSYYEQNGKKDGLPTYEVSFRIYANGVSRKLTLDYGAFALSGELSAIEFLPSKPCP